MAPSLPFTGRCLSKNSKPTGRAPAALNHSMTAHRTDLVTLASINLMNRVAGKGRSEAAQKMTRLPIPSVPCNCGNSGTYDEFYPCDIEGRPQKSSGLVCCDRCGNITELASGKGISHRSFV